MKKKISEDELSQLIKQLHLGEVDAVSRSSTNEGDIRSPLKQDGWIQVIEHRIIVHDPVNNGKLPVISAIAPVKLKVNHHDIHSEINVTSSDSILWEIENQPMYEITVSEDKLHAYFHLHAKERYAWQLTDTEPLAKIILSAEEDRNMVLESVHLTDVAAVLEKKSIKANVDLAAIHQELLQPTYSPILIARGKAPVPGKDAELEIYFSEEIESRFHETEGTVDFRNHLQIPSVTSGDVIARKSPIIDGIPGYDVYGNLITPKAPADILLVAKSGVELTPQGAIIARKEGRPRITGTKIKVFDISTAYTVSGDVDIETGNIVFSGDVIVYGNVTDNMIIESLGNVYVIGSAFNATITATGCIHIRGNVMGSKLYSGYFGVMFNRLYNTSKLLSKQIEKLLIGSQVLEQAIQSRDQTVKYGQIVLLLLEKKMKDIPGLIKDLLSVVANIRHLKKEEYQKLMEMAAVFLKPSQLIESATRNGVQSFLSLLTDAHQEVA
ncbi:FapA family protein, partial [Paenibacillus sepulcri]|nr:FapA family protein [Paenibacillus sepulcri]